VATQIVGSLVEKVVVSVATESAMMRFITALVVSLVISAVMPQSAAAKSPTAKITISGGTLANEIVVTDPQILDLSNVWFGKFLDPSKGAAKAPPSGLRRYEVSFYIKAADNDLKRKYVLYYYPKSATEPGYIYLPGKGETWYALNVNAILREGQDGKWNSALPEWENLIKPVIARAESTPDNR
jgi:hypothetical protein